MKMTTRPLTAIALSVVLVFTTSAWKCDSSKTPAQQKSDAVLYAKDVVGAFTDAGPLIIARKPHLRSLYNSGLDSANKLLTAVENSVETEAARLVVDLVPIFTNIVDEFTDDDNVLLALTLGKIGLRFFANHYLDHVVSSGGSSGGSAKPSAAGNPKVARVRAFARSKPWRCRAAGPIPWPGRAKGYEAGQYVPMEACRQFPDNTTVETR